MNGKQRTVALSLAALVAMGCLVGASVPLYRLFCKVTGYNGTPRIVAGGPAAGSPASTKMMTIRFDTDVMKGMPWVFKPEQTHMTVVLGEPSLALFTAKNLSKDGITGTAVFNVTPLKAAIYVNKIQCFCFTEQHLDGGQQQEMPVQFYIDPAIATDPNTNDVDTITLSYTFYKARTQTSSTPDRAKGAVATPPNNPRKEG